MLQASNHTKAIGSISVTTYQVYWIHNTDHNNPYDEGYVGITKFSLDTRFKQHMNSKRNEKVRDGIRCGAIITLLYENVSESEAKLIERNHRPNMNIGWNKAAGGGVPPSASGMKRTTETKAKMSAWQIGTKHSSERRQKNSDSHKGKARGPHSDAHKQRLSKALTGKKCSESTRAKISEAKKGLTLPPFSDDHRKKIAAANSKPKLQVCCILCTRTISVNSINRHKCIKPEGAPSSGGS